MPIPKIIIQTHRDPDIGIRDKQTWLTHNPGYEHRFFNDQSCREFFIARMPELLPTYDKLPLPVQKADFFRYAAIFFYGGVYADVDTVCLAPLESYLNMAGNNMIVGLEMTPAIFTAVESRNINDYFLNYCSPSQLLQWVFAAPPRHPLMARLLAKIRFQVSILPSQEIVRCSGNNRFTLEMTGPFCFTSAVHDYMSMPQAGGGITILPQLYWGYNPWVNTDVTLPNPQVKVAHLYKGSWKTPVS